MALQFNKINISINSQNILCESANLSQQAEQRPIYAINNSTPWDYSPTSIKNTLSLTYFIEISNEPNYNIISGLKSTNITGNTQARIVLGGILFTGYLNKLSFTVAPAQTIKAQVSYDIFTPITGNFSQGSNTDGNLYNLTNSSGISNYCSVFMVSGNTNISNSNILQFDYNFSCNIVPIYTIGNSYPTQVYVSDANETITTISELQNNNQFSGQNFINLFGIDSIKLTNISSTWGGSINQLLFNISNMKNDSMKVDINTNNLILFSNQFSQSF